MNKNEVKYNQTIKIFEDTMQQVKEAIDAYRNASKEKRDSMGITEADFIRLNRVIQLAYKYLPKREIGAAVTPELSKGQKIFVQLVEKFRKLDFKKKKNVQISTPQKNKVYNSYQMSEDLISTLRTLRNLDRLLGTINANDVALEIDDVINASPSGVVINEKKGAPGILDDYRQGSWGVERICLDGMQNHLPSDALGTGCWLHFLVNGKWVDATVAKETPEKITKVRFADDGVGYFPFNLEHLHSTKGNDIGSVGQFGEGMKLASMASVNLGLGLELQSQNWSAFAVGEEVESINTRNGNAVEKHKKLVYKIKEYDGEPIKGSRTIFHTPTPEFIEYALQLPDKVLALNPDFRYLFKSDYGDIVDTKKGGEIYVKGVFVKNINTLFSYNFDEADLTPDRNEIINFDVRSHIEAILRDVNDIRIIKSLIMKMVAFQKTHLHLKIGEQLSSEIPVELDFGYTLYHYFCCDRGVPSLWKEAFKQVFEQKELLNNQGERKEAILKTDYNVPGELNEKLDDYNVIKLPLYWTLAFQKAGVKTDRESLPDFISVDLETSLTTSYGQDVWGVTQMLVDAAQNHFPSDSGGRNFFLRFQDDKGVWHDYSEIDSFKPENIKKLKISDNGAGYDYERLALLNSGKDHSVTSGRWGEGLKMLTAAALREGVKLEFRSRNWKAIPYIQDKIIDSGLDSEKIVKKVAFNVTCLIKNNSDLLSDNDAIYDRLGQKLSEMSSTTFLDPSPELINEFKRLKNKIVFLQKEKPIVSVANTHVIDFCSGNIFVRNILVPNKHGVKYGYHFSDFNIEGRDRNLISSAAIQENLRTFLSGVKDERFISNFLRDAKESVDCKDNFIEFETDFSIPPESEQADIWIKVFQEIFGFETTIRSVNDLDMNAAHTAQHVGLSTVTLPKCVAKALMNAIGRGGKRIPSYHQKLETMVDNIHMVNNNDLSDYEKFIISYLSENPLIESSVKTIGVYFYSDDYHGPQALGLGNSNGILINRKVLNGDLLELLHVFYHESAHYFTNAEDADIAFRNYLTKLLAKVTVQSFPLEKALLDKLGKDKYDLITGQLESDWQRQNWISAYNDLPEDIQDEVNNRR